MIPWHTAPLPLHPGRTSAQPWAIFTPRRLTPLVRGPGLAPRSDAPAQEKPTPFTETVPRETPACADKLPGYCPTQQDGSNQSPARRGRVSSGEALRTAIRSIARIIQDVGALRRRSIPLSAEAEQSPGAISMIAARAPWSGGVYGRGSARRGPRRGGPLRNRVRRYNSTSTSRSNTCRPRSSRRQPRRMAVWPTACGVMPRM